MSRRFVGLPAGSPVPLVFAALLPFAAGAQPSPRSVEGASVPRELALALLSPFGGPRTMEPEILVGRAPQWLPANAVPGGQGVEPLGALEYKREPESPSYGTAVFVVPGPPDSVLDAYQRALEGAGWTRARMGAERGGFVPSDIRRPVILCHDSTAVFASAAPRSAGRSGTQLRLTVSGARRGLICGEPRDEVRVPLDGGPPLPDLHAPAGARSRGSSGGTSMSSDGSGIQSRAISSRPTTDMSPAAIVTPISAPRAGQRDVSLRLVRATAIDD